MKRFLMYFLLLCLCFGSIACQLDKSIEQEEELYYIDNSYNNYINNNGEFAGVGNRIFYCIRGENKWGFVAETLLEITEEGSNVIFDKQVDLSIYPGEDKLYIFGGDLIPGAFQGYTQKNYIYDLNKNELVRSEELENNVEYYKFVGNKAYHSNDRDFRNTVNIICDEEVLLRNLGYPSTIYITDDYIYYTDELARKYGIMRYDFKTRKSEQLNELHSRIIDKHEGYFGDYVIRTVGIDMIIVENDYLVYLKSTQVYNLDDEDDDADNWDYEYSIEVNRIVAGKLQEVTSIAQTDKQLSTFNIFDGTMYYCQGNSLFSYELESGKTKKLFVLADEIEEDDTTDYAAFGWISILDNRWLYVQIAGDIYKIEQKGGKTMLLVYEEDIKDDEDEDDYEDDYDYDDEYDESIGTLTALVSGINYRSSTEITAKSRKGSLKKGKTYTVYDYAPCWPFKVGKYLVNGWFRISIGNNEFYVADIEGLVKFNEYE